eukprot:CAMPEP_0114677198 /NCGR_PEP_ID=MMETSP0191-20121206/50220_1 /TAXON_ID=126664 /ORGANISM="Sorites sp." /LENGTH=50 /DNA_ID=CAMNT_0001949405 /DNA_START=216 /DNA_END=364 /DNA_ORIENTATION=+
MARTSFSVIKPALELLLRGSSSGTERDLERTLFRAACSDSSDFSSSSRLR